MTAVIASPLLSPPARDAAPRALAARSLAVTVLSGGPSKERDVSLRSGRAVAEALRAAGHDVDCRDISPADLSALDRPADAIFVALHGTFGEDGQVQRLLESRGLRYAGSSPDACALAMHKVRAKQQLIRAGLPTPQFEVAAARNAAALQSAWRGPAVVKPVSEGSSIACHVVRDPRGLAPAIQDVIAAYGEALVEEYIPGLELTVSVLGDDVLPPIEIRAQSDFYDYHAKYAADDTRYLFDIDLPLSLLSEIGAMSLAAHRALGCRDFSRVDWRVDPRRGAAFILELNAIPGFTDHSLLPMAAARVGLDMPKLCDRIIRMAMERE